MHLYLILGLEARARDLRDRQRLVVRLLAADDRCVRRKREVDARERNQVGLELCQETELAVEIFYMYMYMHMCEIV